MEDQSWKLGYKNYRDYIDHTRDVIIGYGNKILYNIRGLVTSEITGRAGQGEGASSQVKAVVGPLLTKQEIARTRGNEQQYFVLRGITTRGSGSEADRRSQGNKREESCLVARRIYTSNALILTPILNFKSLRRTPELSRRIFISPNSIKLVFNTVTSIPRCYKIAISYFDGMCDDLAERIDMF